MTQPQTPGYNSRPAYGLALMTFSSVILIPASPIIRIDFSISAVVTVLSGTLMAFVWLRHDGVIATPVRTPVTIMFVLITWLCVVGKGAIDLGGLQQTLLWISCAFGFLVGAGVWANDREPIFRTFDTIARLTIGALALTFLVSAFQPGLLGNRVLGLAALVPMSWFVSRWRLTTGSERTWVLLTLGFIVLTLSRTASVVALILILLFRPRKSSESPVKGLLIAAAASAVAIFVIYNWSPFRERFFTGDLSLRIGPFTINGMGRNLIWTTLWQDSISDWFTGHGIGSARIRTREIAAALEHPHQDYLRLFYEGGIVGILLWIALLVVLSTLLFRVSKSSASSGTNQAAFSRFGLAMLLTIVLTSLTDNPLVYPFMMIPFGLACGFGLNARWNSLRSAPKRKSQRVVQPRILGSSTTDVVY